jgi:hypothetical protein
VNVFDKLHQLASPFIKSYRDDLEKWDRQAIESNPGVPFLHHTGESNTHISFLPPGDTYPAAGEYVKYLFGTADRHHILHQVYVMAEYFTRPSCTPPLLVLHFDGERFHKIDAKRAVEIARDYCERTRNEWKRPVAYA